MPSAFLTGLPSSAAIKGPRDEMNMVEVKPGDAETGIGNSASKLHPPRQW